jgi:cell wall-associated NlpC family hydrolase
MRTFTRTSTAGVFLGLLLAGCAHNAEKRMIDEVLKEARSRLAPDKRVAVFDVRANLEGDAVILRGEIQSSHLKGQLLESLSEKTSRTVVDSLLTLPDPKLGGEVFGLVSVSVANIRGKPAQSAELTTQATLGMPIRILKHEGTWWLVQMPDDYIGWTKDLIVRMDAERFAEWSAKRKVVATAEVGFTHLTKDLRSEVVSDFVSGCLFAFLGEEGGCYHVAYPDGRNAYLDKKQGALFDEWLARAKDTPENILATARRYYGVPYLWGGTSAKGFDCSGFARTVYLLNGTLLPRDADQQWEVGEPVDTSHGLSSLEPGVLVFFKDEAKPGKTIKIDHVGISMGGGRFIHNPATQAYGVRTNSFTPGDPEFSQYLRDAFAGARKITGFAHGVQCLSGIPYYNGHGYEQ